MPESIRDENTGVTIQVNDDGSINTFVLNSFIPEAYDYVGVAYPDTTTETYTFKSGGSGGTTEATITLVYVDSTKARLSSATKV